MRKKKDDGLKAIICLAVATLAVGGASIAVSSMAPELQKEDLSFLSRSFERHFNERPYLKHYCYLFLSLTTMENPDKMQGERRKKESLWPVH